MEYQAKLNEKYTPALHSISSFEGTSYKKLEDIATSSFITSPPGPPVAGDSGSWFLALEFPNSRGCNTILQNFHKG